MRRIVSVLTAILLLVPGMALAESTDLAAAPQAVVELLYAGEYQQVFDQSAADVQAALVSTDGFAASWAQLVQTFGAYQGIVSAGAQEQSGMIVADVVCAHETADITIHVVLLEDGLLAGITVAAVTPKAAESTADTSLFTTEAVTLRPGEADETQGMLTLPNGEGPFPAVIMMQGSGPSDMDETAFGLAPFRDLAEGLAQAGVASIRYDKYTYAHADLLKADPDLVQRLTIEEEYMLDARDALALLQADARIQDIYLLGHSEGGMIAPRVILALGADHFAGGILLAGSPLPLWKIQYRQNLAVISQMAEEQQDAALALLDAEATKADTLAFLSDAELQSMTFFGISAYYQADLLSVDAAQAALSLQKPLLIIQGGKDWQVTPADGIDAWQAALGDQAFVTYRHYPNLTHMLFEMEGESAGDTSDYQVGSVVSQSLIDDIAAWILR